MTPRPKIVVLTPVKNEAWILDRFLRVTSEFADHIIVADQGSTDGSWELAVSYPKVTAIRNESPAYDEAARQRLLIDTAREVVAGQRLLLALDADEIVAADAMASEGWRRMLTAAPGTVILMEKLDLFAGTAQCVRWDTSLFELGYMDDGAAHTPKHIHSVRIPSSRGARRLEITDVKVLHYAMTRCSAQFAKYRMYSVVENVARSNPVWRRRRRYGRNAVTAYRDVLRPTDPAWFDGWTARGIDVHSVQEEPYYWQDFEVLRHFARHGTRRFWLDEIWTIDWEQCRREAEARGVSEIPRREIKPAPLVIRGAGAGLDLGVRVGAKIRGTLARLGRSGDRR